MLRTDADWWVLSEETRDAQCSSQLVHLKVSYLGSVWVGCRGGLGRIYAKERLFVCGVEEGLKLV